MIRATSQVWKWDLGPNRAVPFGLLHRQAWSTMSSNFWWSRALPNFWRKKQGHPHTVRCQRLWECASVTPGHRENGTNQPPAYEMIEGLVPPRCPLQILKNKSQSQQGTSSFSFRVDFWTRSVLRVGCDMSFCKSKPGLPLHPTQCR